ncbi:MAG: GUN4 domain-containing protein [Nodosilinea sp.]
MASRFKTVSKTRKLCFHRLWVKYSNGKFGFSVQKQIYVECGARLDGNYPGDKIWYDSCDRVGWRKSGKYLHYNDLQANPSLSPTGEFPAPWPRWRGYSLLSHRDL